MLWRLISRSPIEDDARAADPAGTNPLLALQRRIGNRAVQRLVREARASEAPDRATSPASTGGAALDTDTRAHMETTFGEPLGDVRVHTGPEAGGETASLGA